MRLVTISGRGRDRAERENGLTILMWEDSMEIIQGQDGNIAYNQLKMNYLFNICEGVV